MKVVQSCPTLCNPRTVVHCSPLGSSAHRILQARTLAGSSAGLGSYTQVLVAHWLVGPRQEAMGWEVDGGGMPTECILLGCGLVSPTIMGGHGRPPVLPSLGQWDRRDPIPTPPRPCLAPQECVALDIQAGCLPRSPMPARAD